MVNYCFEILQGGKTAKFFFLNSDFEFFRCETGRSALQEN